MIAGHMSVGDVDIADWSVGVCATGDSSDECGSVSVILDIDVIISWIA